MGNVKILERLGPDPSRDRFDELYQAARASYVVNFLARLALPKGSGEVIRSHIHWLGIPPFGQARSVDALRSLFEIGARWESSPPDEIASIRRSLLRMSDSTFVDVMKLLATGNHCSPTILQALGQTPTMHARMKKVGFFPPAPEDKRSFYPSRPTRSREVLTKFGVQVQKTKPRLPRFVEIGTRHRGGREIQLDRAALFDRVWSEPIEKLANGWGLSGRGLSKACQRLKIPVPPRGFWAKVQHGQQVRRPFLPELQPGEAEEISIHLPA